MDLADSFLRPLISDRVLRTLTQICRPPHFMFFFCSRVVDLRNYFILCKCFDLQNYFMVFGLGLSRLSGPSRGLGHWMHIYIYTFIYAVHMMSLWYDGSGNLYASKAASIKLIARNYFGSRYCRLLVTLSSTQMPPMKRLHKKTKATANKKVAQKRRLEELQLRPRSQVMVP